MRGLGVFPATLSFLNHQCEVSIRQSTTVICRERVITLPKNKVIFLSIGSRASRDRLLATHRHGRMPLGGLRDRFVCLTLFPNKREAVLKVKIPGARIENLMPSSYRGTDFSTLTETFKTAWGGGSHNDLPLTAVRSTSPCPWFEKHDLGCLQFLRPDTSISRVW